ncbi:MAG: prephenate dehydrogenase, partial [Fusobacteriaceae bacterium]
MELKNLVATVVGLGVVGGSYAEGLKKIGIGKVYGIDKNPETLIKAKSKNFIDEGHTTGETALRRADIIIVALYPELLKEFFLENNKYFKANAIITDVAGIKGKILDEVVPIVREDVDFILGHPMAGKEKLGIDFADVNVFKNANYILIKNEKNIKANLLFLENIILELGFKNVTYLTAADHDEIIAFTSQLTHIIAVALINSDDDKFDTSKFIGDSFRDLTRIAKINENLWTELFLGNKKNLLSKIENFEKKLDLLKEFIQSDNISGLKEEFK